MNILVTGSGGFIGRNLCVALRRQADYEVLEFDIQQAPEELPGLAARADLVFHLAGVNRPQTAEEFQAGNAGLTQTLCASLLALGRKTTIVLSSSTQAELDNPYGRSKKAAEAAVLDYHQRTGAPVRIYRFPNVFGKWSRPNYNTVVATFCHNISRGLPVQLSNPANVIRFVYIDDIVRAFVEIAASPDLDLKATRQEVHPVFTITLGELHDLLLSFKQGREKALLPDLSNSLVKYLYSTYVSFYDPQDLARTVDLKTDDRGWLFELIKSPHAGQIFVSRTRPGITRGNHYHDTKIEKFCVIQGEGVIRFRHVLQAQGAERRAQSAERRAQSAEREAPLTSDLRPLPSALCPLPSPRRPLASPISHLRSPISDIIEYPVNDREIRVVDIPPGYTHSIENTGATDMITLFWANEIFDPQRPDTYPAPVVEGRAKSEDGGRKIEDGRSKIEGNI
jgi:UDP-2-acetamido-2,6-beta-L-arabino-hexul-4-ose reductase